METVKIVLNFCNAFLFYDYKNLGITDEFNQARKCIINNFHETIPVERILMTLCITDDLFLDINANNDEDVLDIIHDLRSKRIYMFGFDKMVKKMMLIK